MTIIRKIAALLLVIVLAVCVITITTVNAENVQVDDTEDSTGITVYYKCESCVPYIYYWNALPTNLEVEYPGVKMTKDASQGSDWYKFTFATSTKVNMMFTNGSNKLEGQLTPELTRATGTWWYKNGKWKAKNPDKPDEYESTDMREDSIYFVITSRFYDGDKSNNVHCWDDNQAGNPDTDPAWRGDFKGLIEKLDYIKALGFSAIWITPVVQNASGYDYHGYHAMDFTKVDERLESQGATYQDLIDAAHDKGMKIIQDVVWNHTGNFGETNLCPEFTKKFDKIEDLANLEKSMIPTKSLLDAAGVKTAEEYWKLTPAKQYGARLNLMKNTEITENNTTGTWPDVKDDTMAKVSTSPTWNKNNYWHTGYFQSLNWDDWTCKYAQIAGDCVDLNTENAAVAKYTTDAYSDYIDMGVDGFRVDTTRHMSRLSLNMMYNNVLNNYAKSIGHDNFYMFGEVCCRFSQVWYRDHACESCQFYTWAEPDTSLTSKWSMNTDPTSINDNMNLTFEHYRKYDNTNNQPTSDNAFLDGITYHAPDYSKNSGMGTIDFQMHWCFDHASGAYDIAKAEDKYYNDSTWNVTYVESHDYSPDGCQQVRFTGGTQTWAENLDLMFTFRGIPCLYYGGEIEFQKGEKIDVGPNAPLSTTGRAYFGDNIEGSVNATDFSEYTASGAAAKTLESPLAKHLSKLNAIRRAVPALQKGQYTVSTNYVNGNMAYVKRYTDKVSGVDSLALVTISDGASFSNIPNGKYIDAVTGDIKNVTDGKLTVSSPGKANMRVYVCCANGFTGISGAIGGTSGQSYLK